MAQIDARRQALEQRINEALKLRDKERQAEATKTARLKELRLAKEAADRDATAHRPAVRRTKSKTAAGH
jgi:hypothetical protein